MNREQVYQTINAERDYQDEKWGGRQHDEGLTVSDFVCHVHKFVMRAGRADRPEAALHEVRKIAALAVACLEIHGAPRRDA